MLTLTITVTGQNEIDLTEALKYISRAIEDGCTSGLDGNGERDYTFKIVDNNGR